jgi:hypothetical protein
VLATAASATARLGHGCVVVHMRLSWRRLPRCHAKAATRQKGARHVEHGAVGLCVHEGLGDGLDDTCTAGASRGLRGALREACR